MDKLLSFFTPRMILFAVAALLASTLILPLWSTEMESPQYHGEEAIEVTVYAGRVSGNLREVETLNQYVGVHLPLDVPELRAAPFVLGTLLLFALIVAAVPERIRRPAAIVNLSLMIACLIGGAALLQYRLYQLGHDRTHGPLARVPDFTPPILGEMHLANFHVYMELAIGGWLFLAAILLTALAIHIGKPGREIQHSVTYRQPLEATR